MGQFIALVSGPPWFPSWSIRQFFPIFTTRVRSPALYLLARKGLAASPAFMPLGLAHPHPSFTTTASASVLPRRGAGATLPSATTVRGRACPAVTTAGASSPTYHRQWRGSSLSLSTPPHCRRIVGPDLYIRVLWARSSLALLQGQLYCVVQEGCRPHSPE